MSTDRFRSLSVLFGLVASLVGFVGCELSAALSDTEPETPLWKLTGPTMGTRYAVSLVGGTEAEAGRLRDRIDGRLAEVNRLMSTYDPESELSRFNASRGADWFDVSGETAVVVRAAIELARVSGGAYDPTVGPLVNLWGFGPDGDRDAPPSERETTELMSAIGYDQIDVRTDPPALRKRSESAYVDLSSIAKGHGVDAVAELLTEAGVGAFMVEIGGEVRTRGTKPGGLPWRIGVERADTPLRPTAGGRSLQRVVELVDRSLATSGDYRNYFEHEGRRYSHTIDPRTGRPVEHGLATVTVLAPTCREADGLATALLVLGPVAGYDWAVELGVPALFVTRSDDEELAERVTPAWNLATPANPSP